MKKLSWLLLSMAIVLFMTCFTYEASAKYKLKKTSWKSESLMIGGHSYVELFFYRSGRCSMIIKSPGEDKYRHSEGTYTYKDTTLTINLFSGKSLAFAVLWDNESRIKLIGPSGDGDYFLKGSPEEECRHCGGGGGCETCNGKGEHRHNYGSTHTCGLCGGTGVCYHCKGKGYLKL